MMQPQVMLGLKRMMKKTNKNVVTGNFEVENLTEKDATTGNVEVVEKTNHTSTQRLTMKMLIGLLFIKIVFILSLRVVYLSKLYFYFNLGKLVNIKDAYHHPLFYKVQYKLSWTYPKN